MSLGQKQELFARKLPLLLNHVHELGYEARLGDLFRDPRAFGHVGEFKGYGHKNSCHKLKLALDINITQNGVYLTGPAAEIAHNRIHDYWDMIGGSPRIAHDLNHYSLAHEGMR